MINIEYGKMVYDKMTMLPYPWKDYITLKYNNVEFGINNCEGAICLPMSHKEDITVSKIISALTDELKIVQKELQDFPFKLVPVTNHTYQLSGISFYVEDDCIDVKDRIIINNTSLSSFRQRTQGDKYLYKWQIGWNKDNIKLLDFDNYQLNNIILGVSCIVWDPANIFNLKDMELRGNFPTIKDLTIYNNISTSNIQLHPIFGVKWHIFNDSQEEHNITFYKGPVYNELFDNVYLLKFKPGSITKKTRIKSTMIRFKILLHPENIKERPRKLKNTKLAEIKDEDEYYNDICHICETKLYDDIYVLEITIPDNRSTTIDNRGSLNKIVKEYNIHFGLCDICGSDTNLIQNNVALCPNQWKILRVTFPRTFKEVLELYNYSVNDIRVLNYLHNLIRKEQLIPVYKNSISGKNFHSIDDVKKLISGEYADYQYLFRYSFPSEYTCG